MFFLGFGCLLFWVWRIFFVRKREKGFALKYTYKLLTKTAKHFSNFFSKKIPSKKYRFGGFSLKFPFE